MVTVPAGSLSNAALVGAKTVNVPFPLRVSASPAAFTAASNVESWGAPAAVAAIDFKLALLFALKNISINIQRISCHFVEYNFKMQIIYNKMKFCRITVALVPTLPGVVQLLDLPSNYLLGSNQ